MKKAVTSILRLVDASAESKAKVLELLEEHKRQIMDTKRHEGVKIIESPMDSAYVSVTIFPKSQEEWENYNQNERPKMKEWFAQNVLSQVKVVHAFELEIPENNG